MKLSKDTPHDKSVDAAVQRGFLIGALNVGVDWKGRLIRGSRVTHEWQRRCNRLRVPDLAVNPRARGGSHVRLDLCQAGLRLRLADVVALNQVFWPLRKGRHIFAPFTAVYSAITVDASHLDAVVTRLIDATGRALAHRELDVTEAT